MLNFQQHQAEQSIKINPPPRAKIIAAEKAVHEAKMVVSRLRDEIEEKLVPWRKEYAWLLDEQARPVRKALVNLMSELDAAISLCATLTAAAHANKVGVPLFVNHAGSMIPHMRIIRNYLHYMAGK